MTKGQEALESLQTEYITNERMLIFSADDERLENIEKELKALEIIKPLCEVVETPLRKDRYLKINGVVVYMIKTQAEFDLLKEVLE